VKRGSLSRRTATLSVAGALLAALLAVATLFPVPYVVYSPGPVRNTLGSYDGKQVIQVDGHETYPTTGELALTTVGVTGADDELGLLPALRAWVDPRYAVVPRELIYPDGVTPEEVKEENQQLMERSQESAKAAAIRQVGDEVRESVVIESVVKGSPADGNLRAGDIIRTVDGRPISTPEQVGQAVRAHKPGETVTLEVEREGVPTTVTITTTSNRNDNNVAYIGISPAAGYDFPYEVDITLAREIGGPSAGLMFSLGIYDTLTPGALTGGKRIAGTGTISADGRVGGIGGIQQKIAAAADEGATAFLAPEGNCPQALEARNDGMQIVNVATLADAIDAVSKVADGRIDELPKCG
jgi:Lon-like protease